MLNSAFKSYTFFKINKAEIIAFVTGMCAPRPPDGDASQLGRSGGSTGVEYN